METRRLGLLLTDGFSLMSYASVVEPFRAANVLAGSPLYRWTHIAVAGGAAEASNGARIAAEAIVADQPACDTLFVFAGGDPTRFHDRAVFAWLRKLARSEAAIAGVSGGPFLLARAGVLAGHRCTIHWEHAPAFAEAFPDLILEDALYVIDRRRLTCAGGVAGLDLALDLIERDAGAPLAQAVSDWFIRNQPRLAKDAQRPSLSARYGVRDARVLKALARMEARMDDPDARETLARLAGVSVRQLERLFAAELGAGIEETGRRIRLERARALLRTTGMTVLDVGIACGFVGASQFSRAFKAQFGCTPSLARRLSRQNSAQSEAYL